MLIVKFQGGLGNQMFQYAFYKNLMKYSEVYADLSFFDSYRDDSSREYLLKKTFDIDLNILNFKNSQKVKFPRIQGLMQLILRHSGYQVINAKKDYYYEFPYYKIDYYLSRKKGYLNGYWQSEKYFYDVKEEIKKNFHFNISDHKVIQMANSIKKTKNSTSLHWRTGDYVGNPIHEILTPKYFFDSLNSLISAKNIRKVFVFSENFEWVKDNLLSFGLDVEFIIVSEYLPEVEDFNEMYLMSICENNIISNSSFSWWGAYLNKNIEKTVIAPSKWYGEDDLNLYYEDIVISEWKRVNM